MAPAGKEFSSAESGALDIDLEHTVWLADRWKYADLFNYRVAGLTAMETVMWNEVGGGLDLLREMLKDTNVYVFDCFPMTPEIFLSSTKPIKAVADLRGLRIRTAAGGIDGVAFASAGASIVSITGGEVYESTKRGVIDAFQYQSPAGDKTVSFHEVIKYAYLSPVRQPTDYAYYMVNKNSYNKLPADLQKILQDSFYRTGMEFFSNTIMLDQAAIAFYKQYGVVVEPMAKSVEDLLRTQAAKSYAEYSAQYPLAAKVIKSQDDFMKAIRETLPGGL